VPEDEAQTVTHSASHTLKDRMSAAAIRALEISVFEERHRRIAGTERVVAVAHWNHKLG
jgi:hypothetical protein